MLPTDNHPGNAKDGASDDLSIRGWGCATTTGGPTPLSRSDPVQRFVRQRQRFVRRYQGRDPGHTGIRAGRGPLALRCGNKPHRRAERPSGRSDRGLGFVRSRQRFVRRSQAPRHGGSGLAPDLLSIRACAHKIAIWR